MLIFLCCWFVFTIKESNSLKRCVVYCGVFYSPEYSALLISLCYHGDLWNKTLGGIEKKSPAWLLWASWMWMSVGQMWTSCIGFMFGLKALMKGTIFADADFFFFLRPFKCVLFFLSYQLISKWQKFYPFSYHVIVSKRHCIFCKWDTAKIKN